MSRLLIAVSLFFKLAIRADIPAEKVQALYDKYSPSVVAVQYTLDGELGRIEYAGQGVVVSEDGLVMFPLGMLPNQIPDAQIVECKLIIPHYDKADEEIDAVFRGRDERNDVAFAKAKEPRKWTPVVFEDLPVKVGEDFLSIGLLPKVAGFRAYAMKSTMAARVRGDIPLVLISGGLSHAGSPVFNADGKAVGFVNWYGGQHLVLHTTRGNRGENFGDPLAGVASHPMMFVESREFLQSLKDPPTGGASIPLPWLGIMEDQLSGVKDDVAEMFGIKDQVATEIGDIIKDSPADNAGLKVGMKIIKLNGKPLQRGDDPDEVPGNLHRALNRMKPGSEVTFTVLEKLNEPAKEIKVTLGERPKTENVAKRYFAEDLGFVVREVLFEDTYERKQPQDLKGVVVALLKPGSSAQNAKLAYSDLITQFNNEPVTDLDQFKKAYEEFRKAKPKEAIVLVVMKTDANTQTIRIEPPRE
jgi:serine protease Do